MKRNHNRSKPLVIIQCYEDRQQTLPLRKIEHNSDVIGNDVLQAKREAPDSPPPPPPMPDIGDQQNRDHKENKGIDIQKHALKTVVSDLKIPNFRKNGTLTRSPTPDYNNKIQPTALKNIKDEKAELESLESYKLKHTPNVEPKPPSNYFMKAPNGTATMKKLARPVSVTIGEYAYNGGSRREPTKLEFLNGDKPDGPQSANEDVSLTNRLQSELVLTLSRSNLRKKTEALTDAGR